MSDKPPYAIRPIEVSDLNFIFSSWLKSYRDSPVVRGVPNDIFYRNHHQLIERLQNRPCCTALVACDPEDPAQIYGYVVAEYVETGLVLHYVYVKYTLRNFGIAKALINSLVVNDIKWIQYSHRTHVVESMSAKISKLGWMFNPYTAN